MCQMARGRPAADAGAEETRGVIRQVSSACPLRVCVGHASTTLTFAEQPFALPGWSLSFENLFLWS